MTISVEDCLAFAAEMDHLASRTSDEGARQRMGEIARTWRAFAAQIAAVKETAGE